MDAIRQILDYNAGREPERLQRKYQKMRESAFVFLRGTCHLFYRRLPVADDLFRDAPPAWSCGDLHFENVGSYKGDNRQTYFDLSDFDEAALAPVTWDVVRLLTSLQVGAGTLGIDAAQAGDLCRAGLDAYAAALHGGKAFWMEREVAPDGPIRELFDRLRTRDRAGFIASRTHKVDKGDKGDKGERKLTVDRVRMLKASAKQQAAVRAAIGEFAAGQPDPAFYRVLDVQRRVAGTGSLGVERFVVLVRGSGDGLEGHHLLDLKQSLPSSLDRRLKTPQPSWTTPAHRIVALQQRLQAVPMARLHPVMMGDTPCVLRELQPTEDRVALDGVHTSSGELREVVEGMARLVAWAHLRSAGREGSATADELIDFGRRRKWRGQLLDAVNEAASQVVRDAKRYDTAFDDGVFRP